MKAFNSATGRGKEKERASAAAAAAGAGSSSSAGPSGSGAAAAANNAPTPRMTNVFALVERFTYRHSSSELESSNPPPSLPPEIQYWAGVIMRNACRKDDSRGGIRQCANSEYSFYSVFVVCWGTDDDDDVAAKCSAGDGSPSRVSSPSAGGVGRPSTAGRSARARRGARAIGSGAARRTRRRTASIIITATVMDTVVSIHGLEGAEARETVVREGDLRLRLRRRPQLRMGRPAKGARRGERRGSGRGRRGRWRRN